MRTIELFAGTGSFSKIAERRGHDTWNTDNDPVHDVDLCESILNVHPYALPERPDVLWASPPCTTFSVASIGTHWAGGKEAYIPKTDECRTGLQILEKTISLIRYIKPTYWFIENPRGVMRKVIDKIFRLYEISNYRRVTVTYCQYGDTRMKPTDIWTNCDMEFKPVCKNGDPCHVRAPRGSKTGTQGLAKVDRSRVPGPLCKDIITYCEENL